MLPGYTVFSVCGIIVGERVQQQPQAHHLYPSGAKL